MDFLNQDLIYSKTYKNLFIKGNLKIFTFWLIKSLYKQAITKRKKDFKRLGEKKNKSIFYNYINPNNPAVKPTTAKNANSIKSLGAEFINKLIWVIILWLERIF